MLSPRITKKLSKEISIQKSPEMYKLYGSILKPIFENVNYYISKKNPNYKEVYDQTKEYLEKLQNVQLAVSQFFNFQNAKEMQRKRELSIKISPIWKEFDEIRKEKIKKSKAAPEIMQIE